MALPRQPMALPRVERIGSPVCPWRCLGNLPLEEEEEEEEEEVDEDVEEEEEEEEQQHQQQQQQEYSTRHRAAPGACPQACIVWPQRRPTLLVQLQPTELAASARP